MNTMFRSLLVISCLTVVPVWSLRELHLSETHDEKLPFETPFWLTSKLSPLTATEITSFAKLLTKKELNYNVPGFCKSANIICSSNLLTRKATETTAMPPVATWTGSKLKYALELRDDVSIFDELQGGLPYFRESMVQSGSSMPIPDLRDSVPQLSFLPKPLAKQIPFSFANLDGLKKIFGTVQEAHLNDYIPDVLKMCDLAPVKNEKCTCATSFEDLVDFAVERVGHPAKIWSTENAEGSYQNVTIGAIKLVHENLSDPPAICHTTPFYFQVYYCHVFPKVKLYTVDLHAAGGKINNAIMACHFDTSSWSPDHVAFKVLGFGPGKIEICHWFGENDMVFTKLEA